MEPLRYPLPDETPFLWRTALQAAETCEASVLCGWVLWGIFKNHNKILCAQMDYGLLDFLSRYGRSL